MKTLRFAITSGLAAMLWSMVSPAMFAFDTASHLSVAPQCSASIEAAAQAVLGGRVAASQSGYRAQDVVIDPILRKIWVRVADCNDSRRPLTLVPISAPLAGGMGVSTTSVVANAIAPAARPVIRRGDAVDVLVQSASLHMELHGKAASEAAANTEVEVVLDGDAKGDEKPKHIRGIATGEHRVEVHL